MTINILHNYNCILSLVDLFHYAFHIFSYHNLALKTQIVLDKKTHQVICTDFSNDKKHDFRLFKKSKILIHPKVKVITDTGYQSIQKIHNNSELPKKKARKIL
ncbi:IS5 family transposase ISOt6 [Orientia tsutsugamushi]|uniref:IS5 family transposase ISOt6 n=1 Tax=Orientia tsutsugamushi TaxID=784 RepID=A0A2R8F557_ORITS|nr:IS5 family transposase ISOt6 [Orientia tsutsugamushi]